jgi:MerR family transcriptional regulator, copper efflux regulator
MNALTSGQLARASGVNLETIRFYERQNLLPKPPRTAAGYRVFPADAVQRVRFIRRAQTLGFSLKEVRDLLALNVARGVSCGTVRQRAERKICEIESKIAALEAMRKALTSLANACAGRGPVTQCPILECLGSEKEMSCEVEVLDMRDRAVAERAKRYGVKCVPAVVINGQIAECCKNAGVTESALRAAGVGAH